jgi:hypothetical protein
MVQHAADADAESRPATAQAALLKDMMQLDGMADDLDQSCEHRLKPPQMCREFYVILRHKGGFPVGAGGEVFAQIEDAARPSGTVSCLEDWR